MKPGGSITLKQAIMFVALSAVPLMVTIFILILEKI